MKTLEKRPRFFLVFCLCLLLLSGCRRQSQSGVLTEGESPAESTPREPIASSTPEASTSKTFSKVWSIPSLSDDGISVGANWGQVEGSDFPRLRQSTFGSMVQSLDEFESERYYPFADFSAFLPGEGVRVGEIWKLQETGVSHFLSQLQPNFTLSMNMEGSGAYGILRAASETRLEVIFRIHGQFSFEDTVYITPGQFAGQLVVNVADKSIESFEITVPREYEPNIAFEAYGENESMVGSGFAESMYLRSIPYRTPAGDWEDELEVGEAKRRLAQEFYKFLEIDWASLEGARSKSEEQSKPIFLVIFMAPLDEQTCAPMGRELRAGLLSNQDIIKKLNSRVIPVWVQGSELDPMLESELSPEAEALASLAKSEFHGLVDMLLIGQDGTLKKTLNMRTLLKEFPDARNPEPALKKRFLDFLSL